ncbi:MAG TPA: PhzF family phenazine biosynthesis protein [Chloroflexota bacterium]|nr:PhzF family phenazine biosynthesis protein [Chloroflexota bacterium]
MIPLYQVDAFTDRRFSGNPAAVCLLHEPAGEAWMQALAAEMNLSETAYLVPRPDGFDLRWFTPAVEVALCGHATLASAHVLWETGRLAPHQEARFHTKSGLLTARQASGWIEMDFPAIRCEPSAVPSGLLEALDVQSTAVCRAGTDYLVEVEDEGEVQAASPDLVALAEVQARGIIVTAQATLPGYDVVSRFFAPASGIPEDPVTGSSHCALGPYWGAKLGKSELLAYQASARGGTVRVRLAGDRVLLGGQAITVFRGDLI